MAIQIEYKDEVYTLGFSRRTIQQMEKQGFVLEEVMSKPATLVPMFFKGAFLMHHPRIREEVVNEIFKNLPNKDDLLVALIEEYQAPLNAMFDEPDETDEKKGSWKKI